MTMMQPSSSLMQPALYVRQKRELAELFGFETRNKYAISTSDRQEVFYAAEQRSGLWGWLGRYLLGHWRSFDIAFFDPRRIEVFRAHHPFRFFFQRLEISTNGRLIGALQQRFSLFSKRFDIVDDSGNLVFEMKSGFFQFWTFPISRGAEQIAVIEKKWSGLLSEMFTDKDNFRVSFQDASLPLEYRMLILAAAIFVDLQYFEKKAGN
jgi:uncharacterized protein YxjI